MKRTRKTRQRIQKIDLIVPDPDPTVQRDQSLRRDVWSEPAEGYGPLYVGGSRIRPCPTSDEQALAMGGHRVEDD